MKTSSRKVAKEVKNKMDDNFTKNVIIIIISI